MRTPRKHQFNPLNDLGSKPRFHHGPGPEGFGPHGDEFRPHGGPDGHRGGRGHGGGREHRGGGRGGFGPRGPRRAGRGDVRLAILSLLADAPSNGYGLINSIAERTGNAWRPSPGSVYPTLQQLVDEELISAAGDGRRTEYELTDAGRAYVADHADGIDKAWAATPGRSESEIALHESVTKLKGVIHQFRLGASDKQRADAAEKLDEARRALYLILAD